MQKLSLAADGGSGPSTDSKIQNNNDNCFALSASLDGSSCYSAQHHAKITACVRGMMCALRPSPYGMTKGVWRSLCRSLRHSPDQEVACLPLEMDGLGCVSGIRTRYAACWPWWADSLGTIRKLHADVAEAMFRVLNTLRGPTIQEGRRSAANSC